MPPFSISCANLCLHSLAIEHFEGSGPGTDYLQMPLVVESNRAVAFTNCRIFIRSTLCKYFPGPWRRLEISEEPPAEDGKPEFWRKVAIPAGYELNFVPANDKGKVIGISGFFSDHGVPIFRGRHMYNNSA